MLAALCWMLVMALALTSYITICHHALQLSQRNVSRDHGVELAEIGTERALWSLANKNWTGWTINGTTATLTVSGFTFDGGATGSANITINDYNGTSTVGPIQVTGTVTNADGTTTTRTLSSTGTAASLFPNAVAAIGSSGLVKFASAGSVDSYDSTLGDYNMSTNRSASAVVSGTSVTLTNAKIYGYVATNGNAPSYSTRATVTGPSTPPTKKIDTSRIGTSAYLPQFPVVATTGAGTLLPSGTVTIGTPGDTTPALYYTTNLNLTGATKITVDGPVKLAVTGTFYIGLYGGTPQIEITSNGSLEVYVSGDIAIYAGGIKNNTTSPKKLAVYGTASLTVPDISTYTPFYGVIYFPNGTFTVGTTMTTTIYGAVVAGSVNVNNNSVIHYDTDLRTVTTGTFSGVRTPFLLSNISSN
ncbi:MAG: hypothetical protein PHQ04_01915 [Opitutaceae bacterium]|nr:hypothetical protein [Opitutaceae bacterium]